MKENNSRREFLSQSGKMVTAAALFGTSVPLAHAAVAGTLNCEAACLISKFFRQCKTSFFHLMLPALC